MKKENIKNTQIENKEEEKFITEGIIALPHTGSFPWWTTMSLLGMRPPRGHSAIYHMISNCLIYDAREKLVRDMKKQKKDWVLFIDSDMVVPNDMLERMLSHNLPIVAGMAFKRIPPFQPCWYSKLEIENYGTDKAMPKLETVVEFPDKGLMRVEGAGLACCLIRKEVFEMIEPPYFFPQINVGEDLSFFYKVKQKKIPVYVDLEIDVGHVADMPIQKEHFVLSYEQWKKTKKDGDMLFNENKKENIKKE